MAPGARILVGIMGARDGEPHGHRRHPRGHVEAHIVAVERRHHGCPRHLQDLVGTVPGTQATDLELHSK